VSSARVTRDVSQTTARERRMVESLLGDREYTDNDEGAHVP
jgi:hypothetical protein